MLHLWHGSMDVIKADGSRTDSSLDEVRWVVVDARQPPADGGIVGWVVVVEVDIVSTGAVAVAAESEVTDGDGITDVKEMALAVCQ